MDNLSSHLDHVFGALADPTRRAILARLGEGEASVGELARPFAMALPSLMKHIRTCRLKPAAMTHAERWLVEQRAVWEARFDRLEAYVNKIGKKPRKRGRDG